MYGRSLYNRESNPRGAAVKQSDLQKLLSELRQKLDEIPTARDSLETLKKDIDKALLQLKDSKQGELDHESLRVRLREALNRFEVTHSNLTAVINNILNTLAGSGV
jgi:transcriptional regulator NrdR family protein